MGKDIVTRFRVDGDLGKEAKIHARGSSELEWNEMNNKRGGS